MKQIERIAIVVNRAKPGAQAIADAVTALAQTRGTATLYTDEYPIPPGVMAGCDACAVIGGDGTLLSVVAESVEQDVPVFGINHGKLGFLATLSPEHLESQMDAILEGQYTLEARTLLQVNDCENVSALALNDIVIKNGRDSRLITLRVECNGALVTRYHGDGLIFATPTGSTAYNLSANGPIVHPGSHVIAMTPICPHTLTNRTVIFPYEVNLLIDAESDIMTELSVDGRPTPSCKRYPLRISAAPKPLRLLQPLGTSYFEILRRKLGWGGEAE